MEKYFFKDDAGEQGPFSLDELKNKNISATTPIRREGANEWTMAGQVDELKGIVASGAAAVTSPTPAATESVASVTPAAAAPVAAASPATAAPKPATAKTKKGSPMVSWVLSLLALGGIGYWVYQDMQKNKNASGVTVTTGTTAVNKPDTASSHTVTTTTTPTTTPTSTTATKDTLTSTTTTTGPSVSDTSTKTSTQPATTTTVTNTNDQDASKKAAEAKKKADEDKKKQLAMDARKKDDEKKKQMAAQAAAAAKEAEMRNNWPRYITIGTLNYEERDGIKSFDIPISNATTASLDRVILRVDYIKKEGKMVGSETLQLSNIPARGTLNATASGNKKARRANVYITGVTSKKLHFCFPNNNGNAADPYFCN